MDQVLMLMVFILATVCHAGRMRRMLHESADLSSSTAWEGVRQAVMSLADCRVLEMLLS